MYLIKVKEKLLADRNIYCNNIGDLYKVYKKLLYVEDYDESKLEVYIVDKIDFEEEFEIRRQIELYKYKIIEELKESYKTSIEINYINSEGIVKINYDDRNLLHDDNFLDCVFNICSKYFSEDTLVKLVTIYKDFK